MLQNSDKREIKSLNYILYEEKDTNLEGFLGEVIMKDRRIVLIISLIVIVVAIIFGVIFIGKLNNNDEANNRTNSEDRYETKELLDFLSSIAGVKASDIEIIDDPVGFKGKLFISEESMLKGVNYFLQKTNNEKMENLDIDVCDGSIEIYVNYNITEKIKTPIRVSVKPRLSDNKDLIISIEEVKFLDLKIAKFIVNMALRSFIQDWFPKESDIKVEYNKGNIVVHKENFKGVNLEGVSLDGDKLILETVIDLKTIMQ